MDETTAPGIDVGVAWREIVTMWQGLDVPEGRRAEFDGENITMSPPPLHGHEPVVDRWDPTGPSVTLFSEPDGGQYRRFLHVAYGKTIRIPEPFGIDLDTSDFPR
ncbi:hypothetical protein [Embleya sp. NPDC020886]|uniref:hypothetical protein n=1 Tax=Embleya sp. NPDC020886 TaxID=3363980 RepID=UPI0037A9E2B3